MMEFEHLLFTLEAAGFKHCKRKNLRVYLTSGTPLSPGIRGNDDMIVHHKWGLAMYTHMRIGMYMQKVPIRKLKGEMRWMWVIRDQWFEALNRQLKVTYDYGS